jgi:NADH-quinone oxidoreductase subunit L
MAGLIPLSGFWAKDEILVFAKDFSIPVFILLLLSVPVTAAYMWRVYALTFLGEPRDHHAHDHAHESPPVMSYPLVLLAVLAAISGFVVFEPVGEALGFGSGFLGMIESVLEEPHDFHIDVLVAALSIGAVVIGLLFASKQWANGLEGDRALEARMPFLYKVFSNKFYIDDFYQWCINNLVLGFAKIIAFFDRAVVNDTGINGSGHLGYGIGFIFKLAQTGKLPNYALGMALGITVILLVGLTVKT